MKVALNTAHPIFADLSFASLIFANLVFAGSDCQRGSLALQYFLPQTEQRSRKIDYSRRLRQLGLVDIQCKVQ
jgi:hypothetical protein